MCRVYAKKWCQLIFHQYGWSSVFGVLFAFGPFFFLMSSFPDLRRTRPPHYLSFTPCPCSCSDCCFVFVLSRLFFLLKMRGCCVFGVSVALQSSPPLFAKPLFSFSSSSLLGLHILPIESTDKKEQAILITKKEVPSTVFRLLVVFPHSAWSYPSRCLDRRQKEISPSLES